MPDLMMLPTSVRFGDADHEKTIVGYIDDRIQASRTYADPFKRSALEDWRNFCSRPRRWGYNWEMVDPITQDAVNSTLESNNSDVFGKERYFDIRAKEGQPAVNVEKVRERLLVANREGNWKMKSYNWREDTIKFGRGEMATLACPFFTKRMVNEPILDPSGYGVPLGSNRTRKNAQGIRPEFINISFWNNLPYPYPGYPDIQSAPFHAFWLDLPLAEIRAMKYRPWAMWQNTEKVKGNIDVDSGGGSVGSESYEYEDPGFRISAGGWNNTSTTNDAPDCIRHGRVFFYYEAAPGMSGCRAWGVICEQNLLVCRGNEYDHALKPIDSLCWIPYDNTNLYYCMGVPAVVRSFQDRRNLTLAQTFEQRQKNLTPTKLRWPNGPAVTELSKLMAPIGSIIPFNSGDPSGLTDLDRNTPRPDLFDDREAINEDVARSTRQSAVSGGTQDMGNIGAKAFASLSLINNNAGKAVAFKVLFEEVKGIEPQLQKTLSILQQTAPEQETVPLQDRNEVLAKEGYRDSFTLHRGELDGAYDVIAVGASKSMQGPELASVVLGLAKEMAADPELMHRMDKLGIAKQILAWSIGQEPPWFWLSQEDFEKKMQDQPPPLAKESLPKFKDLQGRPKAQAEALRRSGLPPDDQPPPDSAQVEAGKQKEITRRKIIEKALTPPKPAPRQLASMRE